MIVAAPNVIIPGRNGFIYVPSLKMDVAKEPSNYVENWQDSHEFLRNQDSVMLTMSGLAEFLRYTKENYPLVYRDVTASSDIWRGEWIDAFFLQRREGIQVLTRNKRKSENLDTNTLRGVRAPGISLDSWIENPTRQGFPRVNVEEGSTYYWPPKKNSVAILVVDPYGSVLGCSSGSFSGHPGLGVRVARPRG